MPTFHTLTIPTMMINRVHISIAKRVIQCFLEQLKAITLELKNMKYLGFTINDHKLSSLEEILSINLYSIYEKRHTTRVLS